VLTREELTAAAGFIDLSENPGKSQDKDSGIYAMKCRLLIFVNKKQNTIKAGSLR
jgi:hypothetical protein